MKQKISDLLIEILTPVVRALVRVAIAETRGEFKTMNMAVTNIDNTLNEVVGFPKAVVNLIGRLLP